MLRSSLTNRQEENKSDSCENIQKTFQKICDLYSIFSEICLCHYYKPEKIKIFDGNGHIKKVPIEKLQYIIHEVVIPVLKDIENNIPDDDHDTFFQTIFETQSNFGSSIIFTSTIGKKEITFTLNHIRDKDERIGFVITIENDDEKIQATFF